MSRYRLAGIEVSLLLCSNKFGATLIIFQVPLIVDGSFKYEMVLLNS